MINIFGYGSLINPESISTTIGRKVRLSPAIIHDYYRTWTASTDLYISNTVKKGLFLDLSYGEGTFCNGVYFQVYEHELQDLDCREQWYVKQDVDIHLSGNKIVSGLTYLVPDEIKCREGRIPTKYKSIIDEGLSYHNKAFKQTFLATTENYNGEYMKGKYSFNSQSNK